jgi:8-oxo-dGTP pyrophosphatase MutT (NUDIX family)
VTPGPPDPARQTLSRETLSRLALSRVALSVHPLAQAPAGPGWNHAEIAGLLPGDGVPLLPAAVLVGLVERPVGLQVVLTRRTEALRHHAGQISFPGGRIEAGDADPAAAALREAAEEIGLEGTHAEAIGYLDPLVTITGFRVVPLVARIAHAFSARPDPSEVDEVFEVPFDFLMDPRNARALEVDYRGARRALVEFQFGAYRIWGATAAMLVNLRRRMEDVA